MSELGKEELELLRAARRQFTPAPDVAARVALAVAGGIAPPAAGELAKGLESATHSLSTAKVTLFGHGLLVSGKAVLLSALALAGVALGTTAVSLRQPASPQIALPSASVSPQATLPLSAVAPESSESAGPPSAPVVPVTDLEHLVEAAPRSHVRASDPNRAATAPGRLPLDEELAAVHAADSALGAGNPARALSILNALGPSENGNLGEERTALHVIARCASAGADRAELGDRFLRQYARSVYAARVRAACGR